MIQRVTSCNCGQLRLICHGEPVRISVCHCLEGQKRTGGVFATQARYARQNVLIEGSLSEWSQLGDSGASAIFHFCPTYGSPVHWSADVAAELVIVAVGAFADPTFPPPMVSVYEERQHPWASAAGELLMKRRF